MNSITIHCERLPDGRLQIYGDDFPDTFKDEPGCNISSASRDHAIFKLAGFLQEQMPIEQHWEPERPLPGWKHNEKLDRWEKTEFGQKFHWMREDPPTAGSLASASPTLFPHRSGD